ncbi:hypothetical protein [Inconstantimicrobium mannanitabidum]|uniref:Phage protein n=1 Tax=Inconstantimicrobium mannanitabidum TaxID=1604901 RepID=A0ACB5R9T0_9CLOT|nr:hypothetical protein [Clostridium sp. TW13]GKX65619.1 phage protein [Clostridium sp. TW13]
MEHYCEICGTWQGIEKHHIVFRSQCKPLENCKRNHIYLCRKHHRDHKTGVHFNKALDHKLKLEFQNYLEAVFDKEYLTEEDIRQGLEISIQNVRRLLKTVEYSSKGYERLEIIKACLGGKLILEGEQ